MGVLGARSKATRKKSRTKKKGKTETKSQKTRGVCVVSLPAPRAGPAAGMLVRAGAGRAGVACCM